MIAAVAFCPHPPGLVPEVAQGAAPELSEVREACRRAIRTIAAQQHRVVLLGGGRRSAAHGPSTRGSPARYGVPVEVSLGTSVDGPAVLPLSLTIGAWLVRDSLGDVPARGFGVGPDWMESAAAERITVPTDDANSALIVRRDGSGWRDGSAAARNLAARQRAAHLDFDAAPFGVGYFVATWT